MVRDESQKGCDLMGFKMLDADAESPGDLLTIFESKAQYSGKKPKQKLQEAIDGSIKDEARKAESLNYIRQQLNFLDRKDESEKIKRFQNPEDRPYKQKYGAAAIFCERLYDEGEISKSDCQSHPQKDDLSLLVIKGKDMMNLVNALYKRAMDEA
jgi:hypothetical protein